MMEENFKYNVDLPENVSNILRADFWVMKHFSGSLINILSDPLKFSSDVSVFVKKGNCIADFNLIKHTIEGPCIVNIRRTQILQLKDISDQFEYSFIVMSKKFCTMLFHLLQECRAYHAAVSHQVVPIPSALLSEFEALYSKMVNIFEDTSNPYSFHVMALTISSFFYETAYKCYEAFADRHPKRNNRILEKFINLVQQNFKKERFLEFYAEQLQISPKHLSRTLKGLTGFTAVEWIDKYVVLEAQVLLKSTNLNIQQISDELNFPTQSFFGKYFKKKVGVSPKAFRNSFLYKN